jgi:tetratricopeptide (TPR) repeat protein
MIATHNRKLRIALRSTLLASVALVASGCTADWSNGEKTNYKWSGNPPIQDSSEYSYTLGKKQFADGLYGMALKNFRVAMVQEPKSLDRLNAVAATYDKLGRFDLAERYYAQALGVDPNSVQTLNNIGYSFLMQEDYVSARYYLNQADKVARAEDDYSGVVGANLASLDIAEGGTTAFAEVQQPVEADVMTASIDGVKTGAQGEVHAIATQQDVAKVEAAGTMPEQAGGIDGAGNSQDTAVLVPAALPAPEIDNKPDPKVESEPMVAKVEPVIEIEEIEIKKVAKKPLATVPDMLVEISNGAGRNKLAARTRQFMGQEGVKVGRLTNAENFNFASSTIYYRKGYGDKAREIAGLFPMPINVEAIKEQRSHIRILLGADSLDFDTARLADYKGS